MEQVLTILLNFYEAGHKKWPYSMMLILFKNI
jgi:hypothetical protein